MASPSVPLSWLHSWCIKAVFFPTLPTQVAKGTMLNFSASLVFLDVYVFITTAALLGEVKFKFNLEAVFEIFSRKLKMYEKQR